MKKISKSLQTLTRKGYGIQIGPNSQCSAFIHTKAGLGKQTGVVEELWELRFLTEPLAGCTPVSAR